MCLAINLFEIKCVFTEFCFVCIEQHQSHSSKQLAFWCWKSVFERRNIWKLVLKQSRARLEIEGKQVAMLRQKGIPQKLIYFLFVLIFVYRRIWNNGALRSYAKETEGNWSALCQGHTLPPSPGKERESEKPQDN